MTEIKFKHLRNIAPDGFPSNFGGMTIAYEQLNEHDIAYAVAICSNTDNFSKTYGRSIASGRLNSARHRKVVSMSVSEFHNMWNRVSDGDESCIMLGIHANPERRQQMSTDDSITVSISGKPCIGKTTLGLVISDYLTAIGADVEVSLNFDTPEETIRDRMEYRLDHIVSNTRIKIAEV